jgi:cytochrome P450
MRSRRYWERAVYSHLVCKQCSSSSLPLKLAYQVLDGESWQQSRALVRQALTRSQVADVALFETHLKPLFEAIPSDGTTVDLAPLFFTFTLGNASYAVMIDALAHLFLDVTLDFILGESENPTPIQLKQRKDFGPAFDYAQKGLGNRGNSGWLGYLFFWNKFWRSCRICKSFVDERVAKALQRTSTPTEKVDTSRYVLLDELAKQTRDPAKMQAESLNLMLAGRDTTASLLTIAFHVLPRHPEVEKKLRQDIEQLNGELPSFEELKNLKYLRYFLNECLYS